MSKTLWILVLGGLGALARSFVGTRIQVAAGTTHFPLGTATVNVLGCMLFGLVWQLGERHRFLTPESGALILTGFMGAFTTFSTYAFDLVRLLQHGHYAVAAGAVAAQNLLGLAGVILGLKLGRML
jgi:CrcB protein